MANKTTPRFAIEGIEDKPVRVAFRQLQEFLQKDTNLLGFEHFEIVIDRAVTNFKYPHNLGFLPKDVLVTSLIGAGILTWNYSSFDETNLDLTTTGPVTVRAYIGAHIRGAL